MGEIFDTSFKTSVISAVFAILAAWAFRAGLVGPNIDSNGLWQSRRVLVLECPGGTDKGPDGHRADTGPLLQALGEAGFEAEAFFYRDSQFAELLESLVGAQTPATRRPIAFISRVDPGEYDECTMPNFYHFLRKLAAAGVAAFNHPDDMETLGQKRTLLRLRGMPLFVNDTRLYHAAPGGNDEDEGSFVQLFPTSLHQSGSRVLKQNRGSKGEGVWWISLHNETAPALAARQWAINNRTFVRLVEASDNHHEVMTLGELMEHMVSRYLKNEEDALIDMPFLPRISEGEVRLIISGRRVTHVVEKTPSKVAAGDTSSGAEDETAFSANLGSGARHVWHKPHQFPLVVEPFYAQLEEMLARIGIRSPPPLWTADFIRAGPHNNTQFVLSEINANCVGFKTNPHLAKELVSSVAESLRWPSAAARKKS